MSEDLLKQDLVVRRKRLQTTMQQIGAEGCLLSQGIHLYYFTGTLYNGYLYIPAEGDYICFVKRPNNMSGKGIIAVRKPEQIVDFFQEQGLSFPQHLLLEADELTYNEYIRLFSLFNPTKTSNATTLLRQLRMIKSPWEINQLRLSARQHEKTYGEITDCFHPGMTDVAFQAEIERRMRLNGSIGQFATFGTNMNIFMGSLLAGANAEEPSPFDFAMGGAGQSPIFPIGANGAPLKEGEAVMVDMAGNYTAYITDMTRTFSVGRLTEPAYRAHQLSIDIQDAMMAMAKPGVACADLYQLAYSMVEQAALLPYFMGTKQQAKFVGHGIGLQINEPPVLTPRSKELLEENMVFAFEPKFVIPEVGAVGVENSFLVLPDGVEKITLFKEEIISLG